MRLCHPFPLYHCAYSRQIQTATNYLSRPEVAPTDKMLLRIRRNKQATPVELHVQSAGVTEEEQICLEKMPRKLEKNLAMEENKLETNQTPKCQLFELKNLVPITAIVRNF